MASRSAIRARGQASFLHRHKLTANTKGDPWPLRRAAWHDPVRPTIAFGSETIALASFGVS